MDLKFVTSAHGWARTNDEAWGEVRERAWARSRELRDSGDSRGSQAVRDYGNSLRIQTDRVARRILSPAGATYSRRINMLDADDPKVWVLFKQVELGAYGLPPLYSATLAVNGNDGLSDLCEHLPFESVEDAVAFFLKALDEPQAKQICHMLGGSTEANAFGLAMLADSASKITKMPNPTTAELSNLTAELALAAANINDVISRWKDSDALRYLEMARAGPDSRIVLPRRLPIDVSRLIEGIEAFKGDFTQQPKKAGRPVSAGHDQLTALTIANLWKRCGLGKISYVPQSRFIRACSVILPWHNVHKSDVAQFMRSALAKPRMRGVVIG